MGNSLVSYEARDGSTVELSLETIKKFLVQGKPELVTTQEMVYFMGICRSRGLNPFAKDCYLIKYNNDPAAIITSIDFFRSRARAQKDCKGWQAGVIVEDKDGNIRYSNGLVKSTEKVIGGWFKARPEGWDHDFDLEVNIDGYIKKTRDGATTQFWAPEKQATMIRKVAESQGLRELWPDEFGKVYMEEEINRTEMRDSLTTKQAIDLSKAEGKDVYEVKKNGIEPEDGFETDKSKDAKEETWVADLDAQLINEFIDGDDQVVIEWGQKRKEDFDLMNPIVKKAFQQKFKDTIGTEYTTGKKASEKKGKSNKPEPKEITCPERDGKMTDIKECEKCEVKTAGECIQWSE